MGKFAFIIGEEDVEGKHMSEQAMTASHFHGRRLSLKRAVFATTFPRLFTKGNTTPSEGREKTKGKSRMVEGYIYCIRQENPIITMAHPGYIRAPFGLKAEFDSPISCVSHKGRFYLYFRANVNKGIRTIQYAVSDNLTDWSEIKLVQFTPEFNASLGQNLYGSYFFNFEGRVMGFIPCFWNDGEGFIGLFEPKDGEMGHWVFKGWFNRSAVLSSIKKNHTFPVQGIVRNRSNPEIIQYYVHNNYLTGNPGQPVTIDLYMDEEWATDQSIQRLENQYPFIDRLHLLRKLRELPAKFRHKLKHPFAS